MPGTWATDPATLRKPFKRDSIVVTHGHALAKRLADTVVFLKDGPGRRCKVFGSWRIRKFLRIRFCDGFSVAGRTDPRAGRDFREQVGTVTSDPKYSYAKTMGFWTSAINIATGAEEPPLGSQPLVHNGTLPNQPLGVIAALFFLARGVRPQRVVFGFPEEGGLYGWRPGSVLEISWVQCRLEVLDLHVFYFSGAAAGRASMSAT